MTSKAPATDGKPRPYCRRTTCCRRFAARWSVQRCNHRTAGRRRNKGGNTMKVKLSCFIAVALFGLNPGRGLPADSVKMAFIAPLSGTFALTFEEQLKQFRAAADEVNAAGGVLGGKRIEILPFDNKGTPQETLIALNRATDEGVQYVLATISSIAITISEALAKHNARHSDHPVLFLNYDARDPSLTEERCNFWHF